MRIINKCNDSVYSGSTQKKMTYVHLVCIITYNLRVKSQRKAYKLMLRVISQKHAEIPRVLDQRSKIQPLLQCHTRGIYRLRGSSHIP